jgi:MraZ protein
MGSKNLGRWVDVVDGGGSDAGTSNDPASGGAPDRPAAGAAPAAAGPTIPDPHAGLPPLFLGTHQPRLDDKGRLFLPARFRDDLAAGLVITRGQEHCLYVFPAAEFSRVYEKMRETPVSNKLARNYIRVFLSGASSETPDKQGRVTVPQSLRDYAGLSKDCVVIGAGARLEVWDAQAWETYLAANETAFAEQSEEVLPGLY